MVKCTVNCNDHYSLTFEVSYRDVGNMQVTKKETICIQKECLERMLERINSNNDKSSLKSVTYRGTKYYHVVGTPLYITVKDLEKLSQSHRVYDVEVYKQTVQIQNDKGEFVDRPNAMLILAINHRRANGNGENMFRQLDGDQREQDDRRHNMFENRLGKNYRDN